MYAVIMLVIIVVIIEVRNNINLNNKGDNNVN